VGERASGSGIDDYDCLEEPAERLRRSGPGEPGRGVVLAAGRVIKWRRAS